MPTVGWIVEDAIERFWEAQPLPPARPAVPPRFVCEACGEVVFSADELRRHYSLRHPLELPSLYVRGEPLLSSTSIRSSLSDTDIELLQCTACELQTDGGDWVRLKPAQFRKRLASCSSGTWNVRLLHERAADGSRARSEYHIRLRIADTAALDAVDEMFVRRLVRENLMHVDLADFEAALPRDIAAREYGAALGNYALGVLLKERKEPRQFQVPFEEFAFKMRAALDVLCSFDRLVARAVCGSVRFNLNDVLHNDNIHGSELESGFRFFRAAVGQMTSANAMGPATHGAMSPQRRAVCPIDQNSHQLLRACSMVLQDGFSLRAVLNVLDAVAQGALPVSAQDLAKMHVLAGEAYLREGRSSDARQHLQAVQFDPVLKDWARRHLDSISPNE